MSDGATEKWPLFVFHPGLLWKATFILKKEVVVIPVFIDHTLKELEALIHPLRHLSRQLLSICILSFAMRLFF